MHGACRERVQRECGVVVVVAVSVASPGGLCFRILQIVEIRVDALHERRDLCGPGWEREARGFGVP